jgi:predicted phage tail component-like protein
MITLDGYGLRSFGLSCEKQNHPITPTFKSKTISIPGKAGLYDFGSEIQEREISFNIGAIDKDKIALQYKLRHFIAFLHDAYGKPRSIRLIFDYEPDKYYIVKISNRIEPDRVSRTGKFTLQFTAYDPYTYSTVYADEILWGSNIITFISSYLLGHSGSDGLKTISAPTTLNIHVDGLAIKPVIEITGTATGLSLSVNGYNITLPSFVTSTWIVDCDKYSVLKNGVNAFGLVSLREFILLPGDNSVAVTGTGINVTMRIKQRDKYI